ncbi:MAG TPA: hypothetical protein VMV23_09355 [Candidatus Nanopelagicaceae bacterium]|nr:hypothetical protein [Candidatus Nanopelagicaceae bacterium]
MANEPQKGPYYDVNDEYMLCRDHAQKALATEDRAPRLARLTRPEVEELSGLAGGRELCADCMSGPTVPYEPEDEDDE